MDYVHRVMLKCCKRHSLDEKWVEAGSSSDVINKTVKNNDTSISAVYTVLTKFKRFISNSKFILLSSDASEARKMSQRRN